jgi:hypothetical protein
MDGRVVYKVKKDGKGKGSVLHRNMIFLVDDNFEFSRRSEKQNMECSVKIKVNGENQEQSDHQHSERIEESSQDDINSESGDGGMILSSKASVNVRKGPDDAEIEFANREDSTTERNEEDNIIGTNTEEGDENQNAENTKETVREGTDDAEMECENREGSERGRNEEENVKETDTEEGALQEIVNSPHLSRSTKKRCGQLLENRIKYRQEFQEKVKRYNLRSREKLSET